MSEAATPPPQPHGAEDGHGEGDFRLVGRAVRNWGRWGPGDQRGTLNYITAGHRVAAAALARAGKVFDLGIPLDQNGPQTGFPRSNPMRLMMETGAGLPLPGPVRVADDFVVMALQAGTQWDALGHVYYDGQLYNGFPANYVDVHGLGRCSIDNLGKDVFGRGVLLDIAPLHGVDWLAAGTIITPEDLDAAAGQQGVEIRSGDIVLFRTGWRRLFLEHRSAAEFMAGEPGLGLACCKWLHEHEIAAVASDNWAIEVMPGEDANVALPLHMVLLRDMGMTLGEMFDLEELAADCAADGIYEFLLTAPALKFTRGAGTPVNPLAVK